MDHGIEMNRRDVLRTGNTPGAACDFALQDEGYVADDGLETELRKNGAPRTKVERCNLHMYVLDVRTRIVSAEAEGLQEPTASIQA